MVTSEVSTLIEKIEYPIFIMDGYGLIKDLNQKCADLFKSYKTQFIDVHIHTFTKKDIEIQEIKNMKCNLNLFDGSKIKVELTIEPLNELYLCYIIECSLDQNLLNEELFKQLTSATFDGIIIHNNGEIAYADDTWTTMFNYSKQEARKLTLLDLFEPKFHANITESIINLNHESTEVHALKKDGEIIVVRIRTNNILLRGKDYHITSFRNITKQKMYEKKIQFMEKYDPITNLPNRKSAEHRLSMLITNQNRQKESFSVIVIGCSHVKRVNNVLGRLYGDQLLKEIAQHIKENVNDEDFISRLGGSEFVVITKEKHKGKLKAISNLLIKKFNETFMINGLKVKVDINIGIYESPLSSCPDSIIKYASIAMNESKKDGYNVCKFYNSDMNLYVENEFTIESALRTAIANDELYVQYQPQFDLITDKIIGMEALVRWDHKQLGKVSPGEFIPIAEKNGMIVTIGKRVLQTACQQAKVWHNQGFKHLTVAVNLSAVQLADDRIVDIVNKVLEESGLDPGSLELEITEDAVMENEEHVIKVLSELSKLGVKIAIDDFGTGYSSFKYISKYPVHKIKIDRYFIKDCHVNGNNQEIVKSIITMSKNLNMVTVAEGAETIENINFLHLHGCDIVQGYYYSPPVDTNDFEKIIKNKTQNG